MPACADELIDVPYEENETKIIRFANYLRMVFQQSGDHSDHRLLKKASRAFGHLVRAGGTLAYEIVEFEVKRALEWLEVIVRCLRPACSRRFV